MMRDFKSLRRLAQNLPLMSSFFPPKPPETLEALFHRSTGKPAAKWHGYLRHYDRHFGPLKDHPIRLLEIGVQAGGSLEVWAQYFKQAQLIVGCDIDQACGALSFKDPRIKVLIGDINATQTIQTLSALTKDLDVVIDDGSHHSKDIIQSFLNLFPKLSRGGTYLIEDLHCSYWESYGGGLFDPCSSIAFFKKMVDWVNRGFWGVKIQPETFFQEFAPVIHNFAEINWNALDDIHIIEFCNSMCVIRKQNTADHDLGKLVLSGQASVDGRSAHAHAYQATEISVPDQSSNAFAHPNTGRETEESAQLALARQRIEQLAQNNIKLTTQFYESTKQFYDASVKIQELEQIIAQLNQHPPANN